MKKVVSILLIVLFLATCCSTALSQGLLSCVSTPMKGSSKGRTRNVELAADRISGTLMATDMVFSFNGLVGPRTSEAGFKTAPNGRGVNVVGGGVAQVASAIYLALKGIGDIDILEKHTYGKNYVGNYVKSSSDAIMTDYNAKKDFRFRNTGRPFMIYLWFENNELYCQLEEVDDGGGGGGSGSGGGGSGGGGAMPYSSYADLIFFNPGTGIAYFDYFDLLQGADAVEYLVNKEGYSKAKAEEEVAEYADSEYIRDDGDGTLYPVDINTTNLILMYQPDGEPMPGADGVPSNAGDFYALFNHDPSLLLDSFFYYLHTDPEGDVYLVEQVYWP